MLKSKKNKSKASTSENPDSPSKTALSKDHDHDQPINPEGSEGASRKSSSRSRRSHRETSIKMPAIDATPPRQRKKPPSRFSLRRLFFENPLMPTPFRPSPRTKPKKSKEEPQPYWKDNASSSSVLGAQANANGMRECPLCMAEQTLEQFPHLRNCPHLFCMECLHTYVKIEIQEGRANLKCPQCTELMHPNDIAILLGDRYGHLLTLYESLMLRRLLATDPDTRWCPRPNCTYAVIATGCASCPKIECERPGCGYSFCYHCKAEWHPNQTCDAARAQRHHKTFRSSSVPFSLESTGASASPSASGNVANAASTGIYSEVKACPRCQVLAVKMHDGSCNHMTCAVCGVEFCWLCMKEISDLHYLSPSGCTFWGKKPWSRKKKLLWQLGTLVGAPVGIAFLACISVPAMLIGIPSWVGRKMYEHYKTKNKHKRRIAVTFGVVVSIALSPFLAGFAVCVGVPLLLCYVYGVVPIALCRSEGCGVTTSSSGVKIDIDEDPPYRPSVTEQVLNSNVANPSIGEVSLGASLSMGSGCILEHNADNASREPDRESASITAVAGPSLTGSVASSYLGGPSKSKTNRLEVGVDVHPRKKFSFSSERLSETVSLSERSATVSLADDGGNSVASTRALAGSLLAYKCADSQSMNSYRTTGENNDNFSMKSNQAFEDQVSLRSLPMTQHSQQLSVHSSSQAQHLNPPRSMSPVSSMSGDELSTGHGGRRSQRRRVLDKQLSENSSLMSAEDTVSERVRFDDNISFIDDSMGGDDQTVNTGGGISVSDNVSLSGRLLKGSKMEPSILPEETAEELAEVISPEQKPKTLEFKLGATNNVIQSVNSSSEVVEVTTTSAGVPIDEAGSSILSQGAAGITVLSIGDTLSASKESED